MTDHLRSRFEELTWRDTVATSAVLAAVSAAAVVLCAGMTFQPGWASGWPIGISKHTVFASFVTIVFVVVSTSGAATLLVWACFFVERAARRPSVGWATFFIVVVLAFVAILFACPHVYSIVHADIVREWR